MANERSIGTFKKALDKLGNFRTKMQDEIINDVRGKKEDEFKAQQSENRKKADNELAWQTAMRKGRGMEVPEPYVGEEPDVPEIDTKVVDLPEEDENEKELIVEHNDDIGEPSDETIVAPLMQEENPELENFDESSVIEPPTEENFISEEEGGDVGTSSQESGESEKKESQKKSKLAELIGDEESAKEIQEMAQDFMKGLGSLGKDLQNKDKKKDDKKEDDKKNKSGYERYPTSLKVAEDLVGAGGNLVDRAGNVAKEELGGTGANMISERAKGVPHYDYTSLFGRR